MICELLFPSSILAVKLNRKTLVIVLEVEIYIYDISNMKLLHVIETTPNPNGEPPPPPCARVFQYPCPVLPTTRSDRRPLPLRRQLLPRVPVARPLTCSLPGVRGAPPPAEPLAPHRRLIHCGTRDGRRAPLLDALAHGRERHPGAQVAHLLPLRQRRRHAPRHRVRQGHRHPRVEHPWG